MMDDYHLHSSKSTTAAVVATTKKRWYCSGTCARVFFILTCLTSIIIGIVQRTAPRQPYTCTIAGVACPAVHVDGYVAPGWEQVADVFRNNFHTYREEHDKDKIVIDMYGIVDGYHLKRAALQKGEVAQPSWPVYDSNALQLVFSCSKAVSSLAMAMAVDRGYFKYTDKIAQHWPEFGATVAAKADITIEDLMKHEAGLPYLARHISILELKQPDTFATLLASSPPVLPKSERAYHTMSRGFFENELFRRVDPLHRNLSEFIATEIAAPLGVDLILGITDTPSIRQRIFGQSDDGIVAGVVQIVLPLAVSQLHRATTATGVKPLMWAMDGAQKLLTPAQPLMAHLLYEVLNTSSYMHKASFLAGTHFGLTEMNSYQALSIGMASSNMVSNARGLAAVAAVMANEGALGDVRLVSRATVRDALDHLTSKYDHVLGLNTTFDRGGFGCNYGQVFPGLGGNWYGWAGWGGSRLTFNAARNIGIGYTQTRMGPGLGGLRDERTDPIYEAVRDVHNQILLKEQQKQQTKTRTRLVSQQ